MIRAHHNTKTDTAKRFKTGNARKNLLSWAGGTENVQEKTFLINCTDCRARSARKRDEHKPAAGIIIALSKYFFPRYFSLGCADGLEL